MYFQKAKNSALKEVQEEIQTSGELLMLTKLAYIKHIGGGVKWSEVSSWMSGNQERRVRGGQNDLLFQELFLEGTASWVYLLSHFWPLLSQDLKWRWSGFVCLFVCLFLGKWLDLHLHIYSLPYFISILSFQPTFASLSFFFPHPPNPHAQVKLGFFRYLFLGQKHHLSSPGTQIWWR